MKQEKQEEKDKPCYCHWAQCMASVEKPCYCPCHMSGDEWCEDCKCKNKPKR
jgi:hypothetical protein